MKYGPLQRRFAGGFSKLSQEGSCGRAPRDGSTAFSKSLLRSDWDVPYEAHPHKAHPHKAHRSEERRVGKEGRAPLAVPRLRERREQEQTDERRVTRRKQRNTSYRPRGR